MGIIHELSYNTIVKIAAGEVIDRPASVARELLDNSIDANASSISIHLSHGGKSYLEVRDNGSGMDKEDLEICWKNHTTSKISAFEDIYGLNTLGFRGEALSSIAEVAELNILSKKQGELSGYNLSVKDGNFVFLKEMGINAGTTVIVKNLFDNLPARKKFLHSDSAEMKLVDKEIVKKAMAFPHVSVELFHEGKRKYISPSHASYLEKIADFFPDAIDSLVPVEALHENFSIRGFVSKPIFIRPSRLYQMLFVNHRAVEWKNFYFAISHAYGNLIPKGHFPAVFIYIEMDPGSLDVNVHPMKREVRFQDESKVSKALQEAIHQAIIGDTGVFEPEEAQMCFSPFEKKISRAIGDFIFHQEFSPPNPPNYFKPNPQGQELFEGAEPNKDFSLSRSRFVGSVFQTYLLFEDGNQLFFIDQHAAHERIRYEKLKDYYQNHLLSGQELLMPLTIQVPLGILEDFTENLELLCSMGFEIESFGQNSFVVRSAPSYIDYNDVQSVILGFMEALEENKSAHSADFVDSALKQMACKASVRAGNTVSKEEAYSLLEEWEKTPNRLSCPHGRPVIFTFSKKDMEKQFKRTGF